MAKILVLYYSSWGHIETLAKAQAEGVREAGGEAILKRVPELVPANVQEMYHYKKDQAGEIATVDDLVNYDGFLFGTPTRFGNMASQMRNFLDQTGGLWANKALMGKPAGVFTSTGSQHWGQETTLTSFHITLLHHGMVVVGVPPTAPELYNISEISGGTPYGASTITGSDGKRPVSENELKIAKAQGKYLAEIAARLKK